MKNLQPNSAEMLKCVPPEMHLDLSNALNKYGKLLALPVHRPLKAACASMEFLEKLDSSCHVQDRHVVIASTPATMLEPHQLTLCAEALKAMIPWRKGPFLWHGLEIEAEWDSDKKWQRMKAIWPHLPGRRILDVGCNNGYYLLRAMEHHPSYILGIDPTPRFCLQWKLLTCGLQLPGVDYQMLGIEDLHLFQHGFDVVLCLGVLYHHSDPIGQLQVLKNSLKNGGRIVVEVQGVDDKRDVALFPRQRYAKAPGVWFLPSLSCLINWLHRVGFKDIEVLDSCKTHSTEQRNTPMCPRPLQTLSDFLDENDDSLTVEGYGAPHRHMVMARV